MTMRRNALIAATALVVAGAPLVAAAPASAIQAPVVFSSVASSTYQTNGIAWAVASAQGKVFVGGSFTAVRPAGSAAGTNETARTNFVVLDAATGAPTSCAPAFELTTAPSSATVRALDVSPDGRTLYVGGAFNRAGGQNKQYLAALDIASCTVVSGFTPLPNATVRAIDSTSSSVFYGGDITSVGGTARTYAAAAAAVGAPSAGSLLPWAPALSLNVRALATKPDGSAVVIGGNFDTVNGATSNRLVVVDPTAGTGNVKTFTGFAALRSVVKSIAVDATGFYLGNEGTGSGMFDGRVAFNWSDYSERWRDNCLGATQSVVVHQGVLYSGSHAHDCSRNGAYPDGVRQHLLAESVDSPTLLSWFPQTNDGLGESIGPRGLGVATAGDGSVWMYVVGEFTTVNGVAQQSITRFGTGPGAAPSTPVLSVASYQPGTVRVAFRPSLDTDDSSLTYQVFRDNGTTPIWSGLVTAFFWNREQRTFLDTGLAPGSTHTYKVTVSDGTSSRTSGTRTVTVASTASAYAARVLQDGPSMYLRYDEVGDVFVSDSSASGSSNLVFNGVGTWGQAGALSGDSSKALALGGTTTYLYGQSKVTSLPAFTLETWFRTTSTVGGKIIGLGNKQVLLSSSYDKHVYMTNDGRLVFGVYTGVTSTLTSAKSYNDGAWHHVAATQGPSGMALYVDGQQIGSNATKTNQVYDGYWRVGGDQLAGSWPTKPSSLYWQGTLDETAVYPTALPAASVLAHYQAGTGGAPADTTAPTAPSALVATAASPAVSLAWTASTDASGSVSYRVYRGASTGVTPLTGTLVTTTAVASATDPAPPVGTSYYVVVAVDPSGNVSPASNEASATTTDVTGPTAPTGLQSAVSGSTVTVSWTASTDDVAVTAYDVHRSSSASFVPDGATLIGSTSATELADPSRPAGQTFYYRVVARDAAGNSSAASSALAVTVGDTAPPAAPSSLTASASGSTVALAWSASSDNVGVTGYRIHRSASPGTAPSAATLLTTVSGSTTAASDTGVAPGTWYYVVVAVDGSGNASGPSPEASATVVGSGTPTVVSLTPVADTYANAGAPSSNFGTSATLMSRGSIGAVSYLRFVVPAAPAGKTLTGATLTFRTTTDPNAGSVETHTVAVASDAWVESTLTWNNRPAITGPVAGTIAGGTVPSTAYTVALSASALQSFVGAQGTLSVTNTGTDSLYFWSSNYTGTTARPTLTLTFS